MTNAKVLGIVLLLLFLWGFLGVMVPESFLTANNLENLLRRTAMYGILGIGVAFVIITGGIDLSIGSIVCLSGCGLALLLQVDYRPLADEPVMAVRGAAREIWLEGEVDTFGPGDHVRYYGGRRAANAQLTVERVERRMLQQDGAQRSGTVIHVDRPLSSDDTYGHVAKVYAIEEFGAGSGNAPGWIRLAGNHPRLGPRDQVTLVSPDGGLRQPRIVRAEVQGDFTRLDISEPLPSNFDGQWTAVPLDRHQRMPALLAVLAVLAIAGALGLIHGLLITKMRLQPFVVTLCGLLFYRGIARWLVSDQPQGFGNEYVDSLSNIAAGKWSIGWLGDESTGFGIPYAFFIMATIGIAAAVLLNRMVWGRYMQAVGRNKEAAEYSGIQTDRVTALAYILCTVLAAVGGMLFALDANSVSPSSFGNFFELYAIAAAVLGGCSLRGGEGGIFGVIVGTALMQTLYNLIVLLKISDRLEFAIIGAVILAGVIIDELLKRYAARRRARFRESPAA